MDVPNIPDAFGVEGFYYEQESLGVIPKVKLYVNGIEITLVNKLNVSKTIPNIGHVKYPAKDKISFESLDECHIGDKAHLRLYYEGQRWCGKYYYNEATVPLTNIYEGIITKKTLNATGVSRGAIYKYECSNNIVGLGDKINIAQNDEMSKNIIKKISVADTYEGDKYPAYMDKSEYKVSKLLSDLADYATFKTGRNHIVYIDNGVISLRDTTNDVIEHVTGMTCKGVITYREDLSDVVISAHWGDGEFTKEDESDHPYKSEKEVRRRNGKVTLFEGSGDVVRNDEYYDIGTGEILEVMNVFVPYNERLSFLAWKVKQENSKESFQMTTNFISAPLGGQVNVEVLPASGGDTGLGWYGYTVGKKISFNIGRDFKFDYTLDVMKNGEWTPKRFDWESEWDTGAIWGK